MIDQRPRYEVLDALRGLCALVVVALHVCEAHGEGRLLPHSHLAVEYFFMLTGFTFIVAYDGRWGAGGAIPEGRFAAFCRFMGRYSFPLYATHYPFTTLLRGWLADHPDAPVSTHVAALVAMLSAIFVVSCFAMKAADKLKQCVER